MFAKFLSDHPIDYVFVCIDQLTEGDSARPGCRFTALSPRLAFRS